MVHEIQQYIKIKLAKKAKFYLYFGRDKNFKGIQADNRFSAGLKYQIGLLKFLVLRTKSLLLWYNLAKALLKLNNSQPMTS